MNTPLQEAFTDSPPFEYLMPYSIKAAILVQRAMKHAGEISDSMAIAAYRCVSTGKLRPTIQELESELMEMTDNEIEQINAYLERVIDRRERAQVEVESAPGKP